ncbi:hypothetical protein [Catellatospora sichuanensis]|uniref:hypothetical protein n=1 Tax=Catellatospora sichuanensis TaxID=1969805 RepID=UPI001183DEDF|nr:hypothetical protein [Catellatospora sichuanensis]
MSDTPARMLALAGVLIALLSLAVALAGYRRTRLSPSARLYHINNFGPGDAKEFLIATTVTNGTLGAVQVVTCEFEVKGLRGRHMVGGQSRKGPEFPYKVEGHHSATWTVPVADVAELLKVYGKQTAKIRAVLALGSGRDVKGGWFRFDLDKWAAGGDKAKPAGARAQSPAKSKA